MSELEKMARENKCPHCKGEPEPGWIEMPDNGPVVPCPVCNPLDDYDLAERQRATAIRSRRTVMIKDEIELLPCPFCGEAVSLDQYDCDDGESAYDFYQIVCKNGCATHESRDRSEIVKGWNTRTLASRMDVAGDVGEQVKLFRAWADAMEHQSNRELTVEDICCVSGDDFPGDLRQAADTIERLARERDELQALRANEEWAHDELSKLAFDESGDRSWRDRALAAEAQLAAVTNTMEMYKAAAADVEASIRGAQAERDEALTKVSELEAQVAALHSAFWKYAEHLGTCIVSYADKDVSDPCDCGLHDATANLPTRSRQIIAVVEAARNLHSWPGTISEKQRLYTDNGELDLALSALTGDTT